MKVEVHTTPNDIRIDFWPYPDQRSPWNVWKHGLTATEIRTGQDVPFPCTPEQASVYAAYLKRAAFLANDLDEVFNSSDDFSHVMVIERSARSIFIGKRPSTGVIEIRIPSQASYREAWLADAEQAADDLQDELDTQRSAIGG